MHSARLLRTLEATSVLLFLVQSVRVLFAVLFGVIYDVIFAETVAFSTLGVIVLFVIAALLTPLVTPRRSPHTLLSCTALVVALARIPMTINLPTVRLWSSILVVGAGAMYAAALLRRRPRVFPTALLLAFVVDQFLRAAGDTFDVGLRTGWLPVQALLSLAVCAVAFLSLNRSEEEPSAKGGIGLVCGLAVGALLFLETSLLGFPNALSRWSGTRYAVVAPLLLGVTLAAALPSVQQTVSRLLQRQTGGLGLALLTLAGLAAGRLIGGAVGLVGMLAAQFLLVLVPFMLPGQRCRERTRLAFALGLLLFLLLNFAFAFTFTYPYTIPAFRGMGLSVALVAAGVASLPALRTMPVEIGVHTGPQEPARRLRPERRRWLCVGLVVVLTALFARSPALHGKEAGPIRVGTYNIHYGYNTLWQLNLEAQARTIEESGADIVMLQEVDVCRITSYGVDNALWLSRRLGMQQVYGPALEGLSGIALLSRFPVVEADTQLLTSYLEQTSIVHARVRVDEQPVDAYGIWLGLEADERARQLDEALAFIGDASPAVFGGDLNSTPESPVYGRVSAVGFKDPFVEGGFDAAPTSPAIDPVERIDYVWVRGLDVSAAHVLDSLASDHRMVVVELALP